MLPRGSRGGAQAKMHKAQQEEYLAMEKEEAERNELREVSGVPAISDMARRMQRPGVSNVVRAPAAGNPCAQSA